MIILHVMIGGLAIAVLVWLVRYARAHELDLKWYQWAVTLAAVLYAVFVLEVIAGFLIDGAPSGAIVIALMLGLVAVIWFMLLGRLLFTTNKPD